MPSKAYLAPPVSMSQLLLPMRKRRKRKQQPRGHHLSDPILDRRPIAALDLHRYSASEVEQAVCNFIQTWSKRASGSVVHVVTGKGRGSGGAPVIKPRVRQILETRLDGFVREWTRDLDDGGFLVLLS
jgi:DNA-nicking Smr family endonuclease